MKFGEINIEELAKELYYDQVHTNSDCNKTFVYKVTNNCGANHLTTFSWDRAYDKYVERITAKDYPVIELIEVEL